MENIVKSLKPKAIDVLPKGYHPEIDISPDLGPQYSSYSQSLIGVLYWIIELGRVDSCTAVNMMSSCLEMPHRGHLDELFHAFAYLKKNQNAERMSNPTEPEIDMKDFPQED